jgi:hypothetical protein
VPLWDQEAREREQPARCCLVSKKVLI